MMLNSTRLLLLIWPDLFTGAIVLRIQQKYQAQRADSEHCKPEVLGVASPPPASSALPPPPKAAVRPDANFKVWAIKVLHSLYNRTCQALCDPEFRWDGLVAFLLTFGVVVLFGGLNAENFTCTNSNSDAASISTNNTSAADLNHSDASYNSSDNLSINSSIVNDTARMLASTIANFTAAQPGNTSSSTSTPGPGPFSPEICVMGGLSQVRSAISFGAFLLALLTACIRLDRHALGAVARNPLLLGGSGLFSFASMILFMNVVILPGIPRALPRVLTLGMAEPGRLAVNLLIYGLAITNQALTFCAGKDGSAEAWCKLWGGIVPDIAAMVMSFALYSLLRDAVSMTGFRSYVGFNLVTLIFIPLLSEWCQVKRVSSKHWSAAISPSLPIFLVSLIMLFVFTVSRVANWDLELRELFALFVSLPIRLSSVLRGFPANPSDASQGIVQKFCYIALILLGRWNLAFQLGYLRVSEYGPSLLYVGLVMQVGVGLRFVMWAIQAILGRAGVPVTSDPSGATDPSVASATSGATDPPGATDPSVASAISVASDPSVATATSGASVDPSNATAVGPGPGRGGHDSSVPEEARVQCPSASTIGVVGKTTNSGE